MNKRLGPPSLMFFLAAIAVLMAVGKIMPFALAADTPATASPTDRFSVVRAEWKAEIKKCVEAFRQAKTAAGRDQAEKMLPDLLAYSQRMLTIAERMPADPESRDALLWIIYDTGRLPAIHGQLAYIERRAVDILLEQHVNDPEVPRAAVNHNVLLSPNREMLVRGIFERASHREAQGLACLAMARYLLSKAGTAEALQRDMVVALPGQPLWAVAGDTYRAHMRLYDSAAMRCNSAELLEEVVTKYGDIPLFAEITSGVAPRRRKTTGQAAKALLDAMRNLAIGKQSPEIDGVDLDGKPLKLSDYRGKVVVLVFWASWCGPCIAEIPHERELVERLKGRPFALLGINGDEDKDAARKVIEAERINWPSWNDPLTAESSGPIVNRFYVQSWPSTFVLDADGIIRARGLRREVLARRVDQLLKELESRP